MAAIADQAIRASPGDEHGIWGSDLLVTITLGGDRADRRRAARNASGVTPTVRFWKETA